MNFKAFVSALVILILIGAGGTIVAAPVPFANLKPAASSLDNPTDIAIADFDRDGDLDFVSAADGTSSIAWHENSGGKGTFVAHPIDSTGDPGGTRVAAADIDGDGWVDVVGASDNSTGWYRNFGFGLGFDIRREILSFGSITSIATADIDRDGFVDVLLADPFKGFVSFHRNPASTTTVWNSRFLGGKESFYSVAAADIDGDGDPDVLGVNNEGFVWFENAEGSFFRREIVDDENGRAIAGGDINRDGRMDVVTASCGGDGVAWQEQSSDGKGIIFLTHIIDGGAPCPERIVAADVDADGDLDVVTANSDFYQGGAYWYENLSNGFFSPLRRLLPGTTAGRAVAVGDVDGDGDLDILSTSEPSGSIGWSENRTIHRNAAFPEPEPISSSLFCSAITVAELDGTGTPDVVGGDGDNEQLEAYYTDASAQFVNFEGVSGSVHDVRGIAAEDLDGDGDRDLVVAHDSLTWFENIGLGTALSDESKRAPDGGYDVFDDVQQFISGENDFRSVTVGDLNRDGWPDLVTGSGDESIGSDVVAWLNGVVPISWKATNPAADCVGPVDDLSRPWSDPAFDDASWNPIVLPDLWFTEFDDRFYRGTFTYSDSGRPHLLRFRSDDGVQIFVNGTQVFSYPSFFECQNDGCVNSSTCLNNSAVPAVDITKFLVPGTNVIATHVTNGQGVGRFDARVAAYAEAWQRKPVGDAGYIVHSVALGDLDGDGDPDVVAGGDVCGECGGFVNWYVNQNDELPFVLGESLSTGSIVRAVAVGDIDRDGRQDIVASFSGTIVWYRNQHDSDGGKLFGAFFGSPRTVTNETGARELRLADLDQDGDLDVAAVSRGGSKVEYLEWFENDGTGEFGPQRLADSGSFFPTAMAIGDVDRDGDIDLVSGSDLDGTLTWNPNLGGQWTLDGDALAPPVATAGDLVPLLAAVVRLNARPGDTAGALTSLELYFEQSAEVPLSEAAANALMEALYVYRDEGSGAFEPGRDVLVATVDDILAGGKTGPGQEIISFDATDPNVRIAAPATFFIVARFAPGAGSAAPNQFRVELQSPASQFSSTVAIDSSAEIVLTAEFTPGIGTGFVRALAPIIVTTTTDGINADGLTGLREAVRQSNLNAGEDHIRVGVGTYQLTVGGSGEDATLTGDLDVTDLSGKTVITGAGADVTIIDAGGLGDRVFHVLAGANVEISGVTIRNGVASRGGGVLNEGSLVLSDSVIADNTAQASGFAAPSGSGGGIENATAGANAVLTVSRTSIQGNDASSGGGIFNAASDGWLAQLRVSESTIAGNEASSLGGGLVNAAYNSGIADTELVNVTVSTNTAGGSGGGGIVVGDSDGTGNVPLTLNNVTVYQNTAVGPGAGIRVLFPDALSLWNSIVAGNASGSGVHDIDSGDAGITLLNGGNIIGSDVGLIASPSASDQVGTGSDPIDPMLGAFGPNGGPTLTYEPLPDSPALDTGVCFAVTQDQTGETRPVDLPSVANGPGGNGCDSGAVELRLARTLPLIGIPLRWCALAGAPSIASPPPGSNANDVLRERGRKVSEGIYVRDVSMQFRSGASASVLDFPILDPTGLQFGAQGNVFVDPERRNFDEFLLLINRCRDAWQELDPRVTGITAVHINRFVNSDGQPLELLGLGGRANVGNSAQQANAGRVMVVDDLYRENANPPDLVDALLGHELGHALSLEHGDGIDNDHNDVLDDDDDRADGRPRFDGPNLMQYRNGDDLTVAQVGQMRAHALTTIPDITVTMDGHTETAPIGIDPGFSRVLDFGFSHVLDFGFSHVLDFGFSRVLDFQFAQVLDFGFAGVLDFGFAEVLDFGFADVLDFGMEFEGDGTTGTTTLLSSTGGLPWPSPIRPDTSYFYYLDLDRSTATGGRPSDHGFPFAPNDPAGIEIITETKLSSTCAGIQCDDHITLQVFKYNGSGYDLLPDGAAALQRISLGLTQTGGGDPQNPENLAVGLSVQTTLPTSLLTGAGWPLGAPLNMQAISVVHCPGGQPSGQTTTLPNGVTTINCQCQSCEACPDYPGCSGSTGTPNLVPPTGVIGDYTLTATITFGKPTLPECHIQPETAGPGSAATVFVSAFPSGQPGTLTAKTGDALLGSGDASTISGGQGSFPIVLPPVAIDGALPITVGISGLAVEAICSVTISNQSCVGDCPTCDDHDPCTDDSGTFPACTNTNNTASCDDGNACTGPDACSGGACVGGPEICTAGVFMNEIHYDQTSSEKEFIELYATRGPVDLTGWTISDQDEMSYVIGRPANPSFPCPGTFSLNAGDFLLISQGAGTSVCTGTVRKIFLNRVTFLQREGDDLVLKSADGFCQDYVAFETGPSVNPLPPGCQWSGPNPTNGNNAGRSISRFDSPFTDTDRGVDWERSGTTTTIGPKTPGAPNMGSPVVPDGLFLNEVHYDQTSTEREFIELIATRAVNLTGWTITDQDEMIYVLGRPANPSFPCSGTFTLNAGDRLVIWQGSGTSVCSGPVREIYTKEGTVLQRDGDDVALFNGNGVCQDYVAFETGSKVNPPPKGCSWTGPNPNNGNVAGRSISRFDNPFRDTDAGADWEGSGATTTTGPKSPRVRNVP